MISARFFRLVICLALGLLAVGLGGLSVQRKIEAFQPLGFEAVPVRGGFQVVRVERPESGLKLRDQIVLVNGGEVATRQQLSERLKERPESELMISREEQLAQVHYRRPDVQVDFPYLILALIGTLYLGVGLFTLVRHGGRQSFLFYLWCLTSASLYLLEATPPVDGTFVATALFDAVAYILLPALTVHLFLVF